MKRGLFAITVVLCSAMVFSGPANPGQENPETRRAERVQGPVLDKKIPLIDTHNHLFGRYGSRGGHEELDYEGAASVALTEMNRLGIRKIFIMPPPFSPGHPNRYSVDDFIGIVQKHPDRFAFLGGGGTLNVMIQQAVREGTTKPELKDRFVKEAGDLVSKGAIGFGELTAEHFSLHHDHPYESAPPDHPLFLLLSDLAAHHGVPIDIHMEAIPEDMPLPAIGRLASPQNPKALRANLPAFERLLAHNRNAKIIWAHVGWCNTGRRTPALCAELMERHPNLYMSFKVRRDSMPETMPFTEQDRQLKPEWLKLVSTHPDRFVIGSDQFYASSRANVRTGPPGIKGTEQLLVLLPPELVHKIGYENVLSIFRVDPI